MDTQEVQYRLDVARLQARFEAMEKQLQQQDKRLTDLESVLDRINDLLSEQRGAMKLIKWGVPAAPVVFALINYFINGGAQ